MLRAHAELTRTLDAELAREHDLPLSSYEVLLFLNDSDEGRMRMSELADRALLSRSGLTRLVDRMVAAGLIERAACRTDRRGAFAVLTDEGEARLGTARPVHQRGVQEHFAGLLTASEVEAIRAGLERVAGGIQVGEDTMPAC